MTTIEPPSGIVLSVCLRCRDGRERDQADTRGGARLAQALAAAIPEHAATLPAFEARGVRCMSQCKRACTISLTAPGAFTWLFGDLDPNRHADDILALLRLYAQSPGGFMPRDARPEPMRAGVLGRLPPIGSDHEIIERLAPRPDGDMP